MPLTHVPRCVEHRSCIHLASNALVGENTAFGGEQQQQLCTSGKDTVILCAALKVTPAVLQVS